MSAIVIPLGAPFAGQTKTTDALLPSESDLARESEIAQELLPIIENSVRSRRAVEAAAKRLGISVSTAYRKLEKLRENQLASALAPLKRGVKANSKFLHATIESIVQRVLRASYLSKQKPTIQAVLDEVHDECRLAGFMTGELPSRTAVTKRIKAIGLYDQLKQREGVSASRKASAYPGEFNAERPNQIWLIDHSPADIWLVDDRFRLPLGRPTLTLVIDAYTRVCVGFYVSFGSPSRIQVAMALLNAFFPKADYLRGLGIMRSWPVHGRPDILHSDNAAEFKSEAFLRGCNLMVVKPQWRTVGQPQQGGLIERFVGTQMGEVHLLPGTTFSNPKQRGEYDSEKHSVMTLKAFERWLALNVIKYNNKGHGGLDEQAPMALWQAATDRGWRPRTVAENSARDVLIAFLPSETRKLRPDGIHWERLRYWADWLTSEIQVGTSHLEIRYDPRDISSIWIENAAGHWARVELYNRQAPFSLAEHHAAKRYAAENRIVVDEQMLHEIRLEQRELIREEARRTRAARRHNQHQEHSTEASQAVLGKVTRAPAPAWPTSGFSSTTYDASQVEEW